MKVTAGQYGELCDVVFRAQARWPVVPDDPHLHTSSYAREGANRILAILGLEVEVPSFTPAERERMARYLGGEREEGASEHERTMRRQAARDCGDPDCTDLGHLR